MKKFGEFLIILGAVITFIAGIKLCFFASTLLGWVILGFMIILFGCVIIDKFYK